MKKHIFRVIQVVIASVIVFCSFSLSAATPSLVKSLNEFNFDFYRNINSDKNMIVSPYGLSSLLTVVTLGSAGTTNRELLNVLHLQNNDDIKDLGKELNEINASWTTSARFAFSLWGAKGLSYKHTFLEMIKPIQPSSFYTVDYALNPDRARQTINTWVEQNTNSKIKDLLPSGSIGKTTRLVLVNAVYFKGDWQDPFDPNKTTIKSFHLPNGSSLGSAMMSQTNSFFYGENKTLQWVSLPYKSSHLAMMILLPKVDKSLNSSHSDNLTEVAKTLNTTVFNDLLVQSRIREVNINVPKFTIESAYDNLPGVLSSMG
ncbi:MAG: hypothetical protein JO131_09000, partial [Gammaproteobacteria bacterium]|nr:hypothetical protein [Gammaproteobacteria bacterium]